MLKHTIESKLTEAFSPEVLDVINESHRHHVPEGAESHFKVLVVSQQFVDLRMLQRHRLVHHVLEAELADYIHALSIHAYTPEEWAARQTLPDSPLCQGGGALQNSE